MPRSLASPVLNSLRCCRFAQLSLIRHYATPVGYQREEKDQQLGDYPQLPYISTQLRPAKGWWDMQMRRDYGQVIHEEDDALNMWTPDAPAVEPSVALRQFTLATLTLVVFGYVVYKNVPERPAIPREYPFNGLVKELGGLEENKANPELALEDE